MQAYGRKCNSNQKWNIDELQCEFKYPIKHRVFKKDYIWNPYTRSSETDEYLESITGDSVIICGEIIDTSITAPINFNDKKVTYKIDYYYNLHTYLLVVILLLINGTIWDYCIKHHSKQKYILPFC